MGAIALWARSILRRRWSAAVALALLAGLSAGLVGASFQAARRADGSIERHAARSRSFDLGALACPPGVDPSAVESFDEIFALCLTPEVAEQYRTEVVARLPEVEGSTTLATLVGAVLDGSPLNGWGHLVLFTVFGSVGADAYLERQILVSGRYPDPAAPDEVAIGELAARASGIRAGDTVRLASWRQDDIDAAADGRLAPQTQPFESRVVGVVRTLSDVQKTTEADLTGAVLPDGFYAGPAWSQAHAAEFAGYGYGVAVRLRTGPDGIDKFQAALEAANGEWFADTEESSEVDVDSLRRVIDAEREAVLIFALIAALAGLAFVGLTLVRELRRELGERGVLSALGFTRASVAAATAAQTVVIAVAAAVVAVVTTVLLSPFGPVGLARRLEYSHPVRFDWPVLLVLPVAVVVYLVGLAVAAVVFGRSTRRTASVGVASSVPLSPVPRTALNFVRGGSPRIAIAVGAIAVAGTVAAGALLASFDRVIDEPVRYGAWWDVAVGQYSDPDAQQAGAALIAANPNVVEAAGYLEDRGPALVDGVTVPFLATVPVLGQPEVAIVSGRAPVNPDEAALGAATSRRLHKGIGDTIVLTSRAVDGFSASLRVTGIALLNNPVRSATNAGDGVVLLPEVALEVSPDSTPQSIAIRVSPSVDRDEAIASVVRDFPGSTRLASPPADLGSLDRLRFVPGLLAGLVGILALASLVHALVTLLQRHARDLAVLAALGLTRRQRRRVGLASSVTIVGASILVGVPAGLIAGRWIWRVVARRMYIPSGPVMAWTITLVAPLLALGVALAVSAAAARWVTRRTPAAQLRTE